MCDAVGNRLTQETLIGSVPLTTNYAYDAANRLTSVDSVPYTWDNNGNLLNDGVNTYVYDSANRLTALSNQQSASSYQYNGLGDRLTQSVNGDTTNYTLDLNAGLTQVLNDETNQYIYGVGRIAQVNTTTEYFLGDALGSVRQLTDASGEITLAKSYQPYGETLASAGNGTSPFAFTGEQTDVSGLTYLRARYYSSGDGRFLTRDTWMGIDSNPITFNKWAYVRDNPVLLTDPNGHCDIVCIIAILIALGVITSGCSTGPEPDVCPPLPSDLEPDSFKKLSPEVAISRIQSHFGIQLPPTTTYVDANGQPHSTSYRFVFSEASNLNSFYPVGGFTPWFGVSGDNIFGGTWGQVIIFKLTFQLFGLSAYDVADVMVHEAMHAWQQYTFTQLAQDPNSNFMKFPVNQTYYTTDWNSMHSAQMEYEASQYVIDHTPKPLCTRSTKRQQQVDYRNQYTSYTPILGLPSPLPLAGYPLP